MMRKIRYSVRTRKGLEGHGCFKVLWVERLAGSRPACVGSGGVECVHFLGDLLEVVHELIVEAMDFRMPREKVLPITHDQRVGHPREGNERKVLYHSLRGNK